MYKEWLPSREDFHWYIATVYNPLVAWKEKKKSVTIDPNPDPTAHEKAVAGINSKMAQLLSQ